MPTAFASTSRGAIARAIQARGLTLIEFVSVVVILAVVAAVLLPRYSRYVRETRIAALNGLATAIRSSVALVQSRYVANGTNTSPVTLKDGTTVNVQTTVARGGIPRSTAGGIANALYLGNAFTYTAGGATGTFNFVPAVTNCRVTYTAATGRATVVTTGC